MWKNLLVLFCLSCLSSCFLFKDYRKREFVYQQAGQTTTLPIIVPKGYTKSERIDTAGISLMTFHYPDGAYLYAAYLTDTAVNLQPINDSLHQPLLHRLGGTVYKGQDEKDRWYREIRQGRLRFGYRNVTDVLEFEFDSATNYASLQRR